MRGSRHPRSVSSLLLVPLLLIACADADAPTEAVSGSGVEGEVAVAPGAPGEPASSTSFQAHLRGSEEVPAVDTRAQGQANFWLSADGESMHYRLIVANLHDLHMAHIHLAPAGSNGPVVVWLYPDAPPPQHIAGRSSGPLATGTFTEDDLVGPLAGESLADLVEAMEAGGTYVNVHTLPNPGGEIRGQIR